MNKHINRLILVGLAWVIIFLIALETHSRTATRLMPIFGVAFLVYAIYITVLMLKKPQEPQEPKTNQEKDTDKLHEN